MRQISAFAEGVCPLTNITVSRATVTIHYAVHEAYGDGWHEPHQPAHAEFQGASLAGVPLHYDSPLVTWAYAWLELHQDEALAACETECDA